MLEVVVQALVPVQAVQALQSDHATEPVGVGHDAVRVCVLTSLRLCVCVPVSPAGQGRVWVVALLMALFYRRYYR